MTNSEAHTIGPDKPITIQTRGFYTMAYEVKDKGMTTLTFKTIEGAVYYTFAVHDAGIWETPLDFDPPSRLVLKSDKPVWVSICHCFFVGGGGGGNAPAA